MSNLVKYAEEELKRIGMGADNTDDYNKMMHDSIIEMVEKFSKQGHSGFSAGYALGILEKVLNYEPLTPLTGNDDEWMEITDMNQGELLYQNTRCPRVFKDSTHAYDVEGKIFHKKGEPNSSYTNGDSRVTITFPYTPKREYVEVSE